MVRIKAKATEPLIDPAIEITESSLSVTVHFLVMSLKISEMRKMEVARETKQTNISRRRKETEKT